MRANRAALNCADRDIVRRPPNVPVMQPITAYSLNLSTQHATRSLSVAPGLCSKQCARGVAFALSSWTWPATGAKYQTSATSFKAATEWSSVAVATLAGLHRNGFKPKAIKFVIVVMSWSTPHSTKSLKRKSGSAANRFWTPSFNLSRGLLDGAPTPIAPASDDLIRLHCLAPCTCVEHPLFERSLLRRDPHAFCCSRGEVLARNPPEVGFIETSHGDTRRAIDLFVGVRRWGNTLPLRTRPACKA
mmetsp:Transcript_1236/g.2166  ORF Transcript_1236/g.2166 Transcript_1236/m.2166 type:complete len:246 (+) Transcript_1236:603-1340(+)